MTMIRNQTLALAVIVVMLGIPDIASASKPFLCDGWNCFLIIAIAFAPMVMFFLPILLILFVAYRLYNIYKNRPVSERVVPQDIGTVLGMISCLCSILSMVPSVTIWLFGLGKWISAVGLITGTIGRRQAKSTSHATGAEISLLGIIVSAIGLSVHLGFSVLF